MGESCTWCGQWFGKRIARCQKRKRSVWGSERWVWESVEAGAQQERQSKRFAR